MLCGLLTGSDIDLDSIIDLQVMGLYAENHVGTDENLCWITKAHYPLFVWGTEPEFTGNR